MESYGKKRMALLVGCNYPHTEYELHGCINDVVSMRELLEKRFGFDPSSIEMITDGSDGSNKVLPTGANVRKALSDMIKGAEAGDVLFFHYSGHGTRIPSKHHHLKQVEAIVPCDFNLITDVDFRELVNKLPKGARFTILSDSCHSGGLIDKEKEQVGPHTAKDTDIQEQNKPKSKRKHIPYESMLSHLASLTNMVDCEIGTHLTALFGEDASSALRLLDSNWVFGKAHEPDAGILLSGCQPNETSADVPGTGPHGKAHGAFTYAVQTVFKEPRDTVSNKEVVVLAREVLKGQGLLDDQHPCLYCSDENVNEPFLMWDKGTNK